MIIHYYIYIYAQYITVHNTTILYFTWFDPIISDMYLYVHMSISVDIHTDWAWLSIPGMPKWLLFRPCHWVASGKSWRRPLQVLVKKQKKTKHGFQELFPSTNPLTISFDDYWWLNPHWSLLNPYCWRVIPPCFPSKKSNAPGPFIFAPADRHQVPQPSSQTHGLSEEMYNIFGTFCILLETRVDFNNFTRLF